MRIGIGYDVHRLDYNGKFILGGIEINHYKGLVAHSDGDCLIHAIIDSILGAAGLYDIGTYFPDDNNEFKNISSLDLLQRVNELITNKNFRIVNIDSIIICQNPKLKPYINKMKENISKVLNIFPSSLGIKATTEEKLGFTGEERGISCQAICLIEENKNSGQ